MANVKLVIERRNRILEIRKTLNKLKKENKSFFMDEFILMVCDRYACARRTAIEYIKIAEGKMKWSN